KPKTAIGRKRVAAKATTTAMKRKETSQKENVDNIMSLKVIGKSESPAFKHEEVVTKRGLNRTK
ncbi:MAG: hypothetical protein P1U57_10550, partial [Oleibacter sp.]|nr:hypothetical protein [Thalassolituus sp.]